MSTQLRIDQAEPKYSDTPCDLNPLEEGDVHNFMSFFATYRHFFGLRLLHLVWLVCTVTCFGSARLFISKFCLGGSDPLQPLHIVCGRCWCWTLPGSGVCGALAQVGVYLPWCFSLLLCDSRQDVRRLSARF